MKVPIIFCLLFTVTFITCKRVSYDGYNVYAVTPNSENHVAILRTWQDVYDVFFWEELPRPGRTVRIMVSPLMEVPFVDFLNKYSIEHKLIIEDVERIFEEERHQVEIGKEKYAYQNINGPYTVDLRHFWTTLEINNYLNYLAANFADRVRVDVIGNSIEGQLIRAVKISWHGNVDGSRPIIFIESTVHAREWIAPMATVKVLYELVERAHFNLDVLQNVDWIIIPMVNPDGYDFSHTSNRMWRKNRRVNSLAICPGVDGNRNYGHMWSSSINQCSEAFPGAAPFSEPEIQAVRTIIDQYAASIRVYLSVHSFGDMVLYPWSFDFLSVPTATEHDYVGNLYADGVRSVANRSYIVGNAAAVLYTAQGTSFDYVYWRGIQRSFTLELTGGGSTGFDIPASMIEVVSEETWQGCRQVALHTATNNWN